MGSSPHRNRCAQRLMEQMDKEPHEAQQADGAGRQGRTRKRQRTRKKRQASMVAEDETSMVADDERGSPETSPVRRTAFAKTSSRSRSRGKPQAQQPARPWTSRKRFLFSLALCCVVVGFFICIFIQRMYPEEAFFASVQECVNRLNISMPPMPAVSYYDMNGTILENVHKYLGSARSPETFVGMQAAAKGWKAKYPVVMVPGFVTSGLEVWEGEPCGMKYFRQRMWTGFNMLYSMMMDGDCWFKHMALNMSTGLDPDGIRLRAVEGLEAADYFMPGFWVWAKLIRDMAALGYDHKNMVLMAYDWRLSMPLMETRDSYFTLLKARIEVQYRISGAKVVILAHSYGTNVVLYFLKWVESPRGGNGGRDWVEKYIYTVVNIAGPLLGVIKSATSYISGEMSDTAELWPVEGIVFGKSESSVFNRRRRRELWRTWGSLTAMLPRGGNAVWGNLTHAPEDDPWPMSPPDTSHTSCVAPTEEGIADAERHADGEDTSDGPAMGVCGGVAPPRFHHGQAIGVVGGGRQANLTVDDAIQWLKDNDEDLRKRVDDDYYMGYIKDFNETHDESKYWTSPMSLQLPYAPSLRIVCYYGVGKMTERAYIYKTDDEGAIDSIDVSVKDPSVSLSGGVVMGEGDGTVTLMSLGYHCGKLWREPSHNPANVSVTTRELLHADSGLKITAPRGHGNSGDHVDIMGNTEMAADILSILSGHDEELIGNDRFVSRILELADRVHL